MRLDSFRLERGERKRRSPWTGLASHDDDRSTLGHVHAPSFPPPLLHRVTVLRVRDVAKRFGETWALRGASFTVHRGEVLGLIGPNGSGKTTLLECLAGLLATDGGEVHVNGSALAPSDRRTALFYMPDGIVPWSDQKVGWVLSLSAALQRAPALRVPEVRRELALDGLAHRRVGTLSKGQRRRLLLAIALLTPQPLLLLDEPFDGLDLRQTREVSTLLRRVAAEGRTLVLSIHQLSDAMKVCDRLVLLSDGRAVGEGTLAELQMHAGLPGASLEEVFLALT